MARRCVLEHVAFSCWQSGVTQSSHMTHTPGKHTLFGRVYSGLTTVKRMGLVATNKEDRSAMTMMQYLQSCGVI